MTDTLAPAGIDTSDSPHYLRALTDMADRRTVVADAAIYTDKGIKLVEKGARIDSRLYDRLVQTSCASPLTAICPSRIPWTYPLCSRRGRP